MGEKVFVEKGEHLSRAVRRLKRNLLCRKGDLWLYKKKMEFTKPCEARRLKKGKAKLNAQQAAAMERSGFQSKHKPFTFL
jgi:ribosomal protein S21